MPAPWEPSRPNRYRGPVTGKGSDALQLEFPFALSERAQPQRIEADEAGGVALIVSCRAFFEGHQVLIVERIFALAPDHTDIALVELELYAAADEFLALVDRRLQHLALGREPES